VHFFASRLKYSRWVDVTIVPDECAETLVRTLVDHFALIGGIPLLAVFDRPKTVAGKSATNRTATGKRFSFFARASATVSMRPRRTAPSRRSLPFKFSLSSTLSTLDLGHTVHHRQRVTVDPVLASELSFEVRGPHFDRPRFYRRAAQVLKPDGVVVLADIAFADREEARFWASRVNSPPQTARLEAQGYHARRASPVVETWLKRRSRVASHTPRGFSRRRQADTRSSP
jgi:hypothetical protein